MNWIHERGLILKTITRVLSASTIAAVVAAPVIMIAGPANATEALPTQAVVSTDGTQELTNESPEANNVDVVAPKTLGAADSAVQYSVTITNIPSQARAASQVMVRGTSKGFSDGNWVNAWITGPDGIQRSAGGNWVRAGKFALPVSFPSAGKYTVQLSLGAYPEEQYSQIMPVTVTKAAYNTKPVLTEDGHNGKRYLHVAGMTDLAAGKKVYVLVSRPGHLLPQVAGTATVAADGSYLFDSASAATLLDKDGYYTVNVSRTSSPLTPLGISAYYNKVYRG